MLIEHLLQGRGCVKMLVTMLNKLMQMQMIQQVRMHRCEQYLPHAVGQLRLVRAFAYSAQPAPLRAPGA